MSVIDTDESMLGQMADPQEHEKGVRSTTEKAAVIFENTCTKYLVQIKCSTQVLEANLSLKLRLKWLVKL